MGTVMKESLGSAEILSGKEAVAGEFVCVEYEYTVGHPIDDTGFIKLAFRFAGDFGIPQFSEARAPNFCRVETDGDCYLEARWDVKGHTRPWGRCLYLKVMGGYLNTGDKVRVVFGDPQGGSPGWQMQTFCEESFEFKTLVDPMATYQFKELKHSPTLRIIPGKAVRTWCIAPSQVLVGEPFRYYLKKEDRWGNPVKKPECLQHEGFSEPGLHWIEVSGVHRGVVSNPVEASPENPGENSYWADLHGQSEETIGTNTIRDYFKFARDFGLLDVAAHQGNDFQMSDAFWEYLNEVTAEFNEPGRFVTFPGYEWSGNTAKGGDRNVYYVDEGGPIFRSSLELVAGGQSRWETAPTTEKLFETLHRKAKQPCFLFAHVGGRYADIRSHDQQLEWAVEVHSAWGTFEWMLEDAFALGYRVGICANSDGHKGRPGASWPGAGKFGSLGGLTCIRASNLERSAIYEAIKSRHFYATTGNRLLLDVKLLSNNQVTGRMGDIVDALHNAYTLQFEVAGTGPIEFVEVLNGSDVIARLYPDSEASSGRRIKLLWSGAERRGRARLVCWDGCLKIEGNEIESLQPINFLNANKPLCQPNSREVTWQSNTTGGSAGMIIQLCEPGKGILKFETPEQSGEYSLEAEPGKDQCWECGGLRKRLEIRSLPDRPGNWSWRQSIDIAHLREGDNPLYVKVTQEDGHMAWSSPIYLISGKA